MAAEKPLHREIYDQYDLKEEYERLHPSGTFFRKDWLKAFGEHLSEMRLLQRKAVIGNHVCYILSSYQTNAPYMENGDTAGGRVYHYFDVDTLDHITN